MNTTKKTNKQFNLDELLNAPQSPESKRLSDEARELNNKLGGVANMFGDNQAFYSKTVVLNWIEENKAQYTNKDLEFVINFVNSQYEKIARGEEI